MIEMLSPLKGKCVDGRDGASGPAGVTIGIRSVNDLWQIAGRQGFKSAADLVLKALGLPGGRGSYRTSQKAEVVTSWRIAPDKLLLEGSGDLTPHESEYLMVLDLGHARAARPASRDLLAQLIAISTSNTSFEPGAFVQTGLHHVGVLIHCTGPDSFDILVPGTWAESVWEVLFDSALPHGVTVKEAA